MDVQSGGALALPGLKSYSSSGTEFNVDGAGSVLDVSALTTLTQQDYWDVNVTYGSKLNLSGLTSLTGTEGISIGDSAGSTILDPNLTSLSGVDVVLDGTDTQVANSWTSFTNGNLLVSGGAYTLPGLIDIAGSSPEVEDGGSLALPAATQVSGAVLTLGNGTIDLGKTAFTMPASGTGATFNIPQFPPQVTVNLASTGAFTGGTTLNVSTGDSVEVTGGGFIGGVTFNVGQGATVTLIDGQYAGTLTGSGLGTVQISGARLYIGTGGLTLNFPGSMLQWTADSNPSVIDAGNGDLTNQGTINLVGNGDKDFFNDGVFDNFGTITQTGAGSLVLGTDGVFPTTLQIESGASYLLADDSGIQEISDSGSADGQVSIDNAGTIRKLAGSGTSWFDVLGSINNTGTIEADSRARA